MPLSAIAQGLSDRSIEHPPYYTGRKAGPGARFGGLPIIYQRGGSQSPIFDPSGDSGSAVASLLHEMNTAFDSLIQARGWSQLTMPPKGNPPDVYFGCQRDPSDDCIEPGDTALGRAGTAMHLALYSSSKAWRERLVKMLDSTGATHAVVLSIEVGQYWVRQSGFSGKKSVELGSGHTVSLKWLTSLETPVSVLQLTGVLINRKGEAVRMGAEGFMARRTEFAASAFEAQRLISDQDVDRARRLTREDLPGEPLAWRVALCRLLGGLGADQPCGPSPSE
jgi:hypothetical protein